ncbi:DUF7501 family protein [Halorarum salinum]|uniref:Uncharacterized protein n=1 Tax=Halorarum salinum TaxID=2743089 RepID=A0A7D5QBR2_9EURY|nr:hypothetical protein [Halobaculum salinum]QLG63616.1 hypothetical protein HUG12_18535 [Halobaculum salinum]
MSATETWTDPNSCPFCGGRLSSPGAGFVDHIDEAPECASRFEQWRDRIGDDIQGDWSG